MPNGYKIVRQSLVDDLEGEKKVCWETEILQDDDSGFTYEISKVFCNHDWYAYGVLKHHSRFIRKSTIAEDGTVCHDTIEKVTEKHFL